MAWLYLTMCGLFEVGFTTTLSLPFSDTSRGCTKKPNATSSAT